MPLNKQHHIDRVASLADDTSTTTNGVLNLIGAENSLAKFTMPVVATLADLPDFALNIGRWFYVEDIQEHRYSNGREWSLANEYFEPLEVAYAWGVATCGTLGEGSSGGWIGSPVVVSGGCTNWIAVSAGERHSAGITRDGNMWAWGFNYFGQLGLNCSTNKSVPNLTVGGFTDWCQVSVGYSHTTALRRNGTVWSWGRNASYSLGDGTAVNRSSPVQVVGGFTDWCQITTNFHSNAAIRTNGTLWTWGSNNTCKLGDGTTTPRSSPVQVLGGFTDWCQVSGGGAEGDHFVALRANGTVWSWGWGTFGQIGNNSTLNASSPTQLSGAATDWCAVAAGEAHSVAIKTNGTLWAWGLNSNGQLGNNSTLSRSSPVSVTGGVTNWSKVFAGGQTTHALKTDGTLWGFGRNCNLGNNLSTGGRSSPVLVAGGFNDWSVVDTGFLHTLAIRVSWPTN